MTRREVGALCDPFVALGLRMAGVTPEIVREGVSAAERLQTMVADERWGVVLVQEDLGEELIASVRAPDPLPLLVPFPGPELERPPGQAREYIADLLRRAVGYRVRLR